MKMLKEIWAIFGLQRFLLKFSFNATFKSTGVKRMFCCHDIANEFSSEKNIDSFQSVCADKGFKVEVSV